MTVEHWAAPEHNRRVYDVCGLSPGLKFGVHNNNLRNLLRGIRERVFAVEIGGVLTKPPSPDAGFVDSELAKFARKFDKLLPPTTPWSHDEFVATYAGRRRAVYEAAAEDLVGRALTRRDANSRSFLKAEKIPFYAKSDPAPRLIHPRNPRYNVGVGVFLKKIEHSVYHAVDEVWGSRTILKGCNAEKTAYHLRKKWESFPRPVAIGLDASRFDQHVSVDCLRWEHARYVSMYRGDDADTLRELLDWQLSANCTATCRDGRVKYKVTGMRFSGDMNTSTGNCMLMSAMVWSYCQRTGVTAHLANNGDDCVLFIDKSELARLDLGGLVQWFRRMGFTMKVEEPVYVFEGIEFCQSHPINLGARWLMVRKHRHATAKDCISLKPLDGPGIFDKWRLSVGLAGLSLTGGVPVQQEFYAALMRGAKGHALANDPILETGFMRFARGMSRTYGEPTPECRYSYWLAFGVLPDEQVALENEYSKVSLAWHTTLPKNDSLPRASFPHWIYL